MILADVSPAAHGYKLDANAFALALFGCSVIRFFRCEETARCILVGSRRKGQNLMEVRKIFAAGALKN
jgi:hypothetical protein